MTFQDRCERFAKATKKEKNIFKYVCRVGFLNKKIAEHKEEDELIFKKQTSKEEKKIAKYIL